LVKIHGSGEFYEENNKAQLKPYRTLENTYFLTILLTRVTLLKIVYFSELLERKAYSYNRTYIKMLGIIFRNYIIFLIDNNNVKASNCETNHSYISAYIFQEITYGSDERKYSTWRERNLSLR